MTNQDMTMAIRTVVGGSSNMMLDARFRNKESAKLILNYFLVNLSKKTGVSIEDMMEDHKLLMGETKVNNAATPKLRYGTAFDNETYNKMDRLIQEGYTNKAIAGMLGIHPNTVSNRRKKIKLFM